MLQEKEFIFPMNYKKKEKFLGFIDYKTLVVVCGIAFFTWFILKNIDLELVIRVSIFIMIVGFFSILILIGVNGENMLDFLYFVGRYLLHEKIYVYRKDEEEERNRCEKLLKRGFK